MVAAQGPGTAGAPGPGPGTGEPARPWHAAAWLAWAVAATAALQLAPSPLYVAVVIALATLMVAVFGGDSPYARAYPVLVGLALAFAVMRVALTALTTHGGPGVLVTLPGATVPGWLGGFTVGGTIEGPVLAQAAYEAFVIVGIVAVFAACNAVIAHHELVQGLPRAFHELGLVVAVGVAFVPTTILAVQDVREADRLRTGGRPVRRGRLVRQIVPVLERGLERAVTLGESMDSRGFARGGSTPLERAAAWCGAVGLAALGAAFVALVAGESTPALLCIGSGTALVVLAIALASRGSRRARYRPRRLTRGDLGLMATVALAPLALAGLVLAGDDRLAWAASPLRWPTLSVPALLALAVLAAPLVRRPAPRAVAAAPAPATTPDPVPAT